MQQRLIKIGARSSNLALTMAFEVKAKLQEKWGFQEDLIKIEAMSTKGDRILNRSLSLLGGKGLFTEEIENALLGRKIDIAVHSAKDMPSILPDKLCLASYVRRGSIEDCFVSKNNIPFMELPAGAVLGTSSLRRQALIKKHRPDINIVLLRGNVETRIERVKKGDIDGTFLALAGIERLHLEDVITQIMDPVFFPPAPAQGCICLEARSYDVNILEIVAAINDITTQLEVSAERAFLQYLDGSCRTPICAYARCIGDKLLFYGSILRSDGTEYYEYKHSISLNVSDKIKQSQELGRLAASHLREQAGPGFFASWD